MDEVLGAGHVDLLALLPCPLKVPLDALLSAFAARHPALRLCVEGNANHEGELLTRLARSERLEELPDAIVSPGFNALFHEPFVSRFVRTGAFQGGGGAVADAQLARLGLLDPAGRYRLLATNLLVLAVDTRRLEGRPAPRAVEDLLDPAWARSVAIRGNRDGTFCETLLLSVYQRHGVAGVERLARAVRHGWHPSRMVKAMAGGRSDAPAVSVLPLFFAATLRGRPGLEVVWPEDGAVVSPISLLVKAERRAALAPLLELLTGPEVARTCSGALFPAVHPAVEGGLPPDARLSWLGWDFVGAQDLRALLAELNARFARARGEGACAS